MHKTDADIGFVKKNDQCDWHENRILNRASHVLAEEFFVLPCFKQWLYRVASDSTSQLSSLQAEINKWEASKLDNLKIMNWRITGMIIQDQTVASTAPCKFASCPFRIKELKPGNSFYFAYFVQRRASFLHNLLSWRNWRRFSLHVISFCLE